MAFVDPVASLAGMPAVLEKIMYYLDHQSLRNVHQVNKSWNDAVNRGNTWRKKLQSRVSSEIDWKEISLQLPKAYGEEDDCPAKKKYGAILQAAQVLEENWKSACPNVQQTIKFDVDTDFKDLGGMQTTNLIAMDSKWIAVGFPSGCIQMFQRKNLNREKVILHGQGLLSVEFEGNYLISTSLTIIKVWNKDSIELLETLKHDYPKCDDLKPKLPVSASGHGLLVSSNQWGVGDDFRGRLSVWRLKPNYQIKEATTGRVLQLIYQENLSLSAFVVDEIFLSEKYIVSIQQRNLSNADGRYEMFVQLRSTADFSVLYSFAKELMDHFNCFGFYNNNLAILMTSRSKPPKIKIIKCKTKISFDLAIEPEPSNLFLVGSNLKFVVGCHYSDGSRVKIIEPSTDSSFKIVNLNPIEGLKFNFSNEALIADEISLLHLKLKAKTVELVLYDFFDFSKL